jgi:hypothetical protein
MLNKLVFIGLAGLLLILLGIVLEAGRGGGNP